VEYQEFLANKAKMRKATEGILASELNDMLFDFQKDIVRWNLQNSKTATFADCGLGKTPMQLEWARHVLEHTNKPVLVLAPLAVSFQTQREGVKFGIETTVVKSQADVKKTINITNYERLDKFDPLAFGGIVLDESSILKSFMGKIKNQIIEYFKATPYKLCCAATPAPNDHMELGNHSDFLNVMPSNEMLSRWFINDTMSFGTYRLKGHAVKSFWEWVSSWSVCLSKPSDMGYDDNGFILPPLNIQQVTVKVDHTKGNSDTLFRMPLLNATDLHKEMRITSPERADAVAERVNSTPGPWIIWCNANYEADDLIKRIPQAIEVRGNEKQEAKEEKLLAFSSGQGQIIITKPSIAGYGLNWQHCSNVAFAGLSYSYEQLYQALRRSYRYGQKSQVNAYLYVADTEQTIINTIHSKMAAHKEMQSNMYGYNFKTTLNKGVSLVNKSAFAVAEGESWKNVNGDSVEYTREMADSSIHFSIYSPPFSNLYIYSDSIRDMGNCSGDGEFLEQYSFLIKEIYRVTKPGRLSAVHCKNLVNYKGRDGMAGLRDFRGDIIRAHLKHGWSYHSEVVIWKDPVIEMQRTKAHGLLYKQLRKDSTFSRQGMPEYLLLFRKWAGEGDTPEAVGTGDDPKYHAYVGESGPKIAAGDHHYAIQVWQRYASPVWFDIRQTRVLNCEQARDPNDEKHICPLQLDVIERALELWTNPGDIVYSPFAGIGSEGYISVKAGRKFIGCELKEGYWKTGCNHLKRAESESGEELPLLEAMK
jgi:DNA modification methylase